LTFGHSVGIEKRGPLPEFSTLKKFQASDYKNSLAQSKVGDCKRRKVKIICTRR
jgi:hypothetical protein